MLLIATQGSSWQKTVRWWLQGGEPGLPWGGRMRTTGAGSGCGNVGIWCGGPVLPDSKNKCRGKRVLSVHARNMLGYNGKKTNAEAKSGSLFHVMKDL